MLPKYGQDKSFEFGIVPVAMHNAKYDLRVLRDNKMKESISTKFFKIRSKILLPTATILIITGYLVNQIILVIGLIILMAAIIALIHYLIYKDIDTEVK